MIDDACGCDDYGVSRRSILKAAGLAALAGVTTSMIGDVLTSTVYGAGEGNILVVLSLRGGADGLSMIVPHAEKAYYAARPTTSIAASTLKVADATFGLHPAFAPLEPLWKDGKMAGLHAIGLPAPNRSHFEAMELIEDADPGSSARIGWLNRMISGLASAPDVFDGVQIGATVTPTSLVGPAASLSTSGFNDLRLPFSDNPTGQARLATILKNQYAAHPGPLGAAGTNAIALAARAGEIDDAVKAGSVSSVTYPKSALGKALATTAGLIRARVGVKAVALDSGGWDHHVDLGWRIDSAIADLAKSLAAFFADLGPDGDRVTVVTLSEFGRRLSENGARGVDHGYGNAVFALGAGVAGGRYYSRWPTLGSGSQIDGDLAVKTDYRAVLMEILQARFPSLDLSKVFPGVKADPLGFMR